MAMHMIRSSRSIDRSIDRSIACSIEQSNDQSIDHVSPHWGQQNVFFGRSNWNDNFSRAVHHGPWPSDAISIESNGISNRSNRNSQKFSNGRKIARMARILMIFGWNRSSRRNLSFHKFSNEWQIIESIESVDWIGRSIDGRLVYRFLPDVF